MASSPNIRREVRRLTEAYLAELTRIAQKEHDALAARLPRSQRERPGFTMREDGEYSTTEFLSDGSKRTTPFPAQTLMIVEAIRECISLGTFHEKDARVVELIQIALAYVGRARFVRGGESFGHDEDTWKLLDRANKALLKMRHVEKGGDERTNLLFRNAAIAVGGTLHAHREDPFILPWFVDEVGNPIPIKRNIRTGTRFENEENYDPPFYAYVVIGREALSRFPKPEEAIKSLLVGLDARFQELRVETIAGDLSLLPEDMSKKPGRGNKGIAQVLAKWFEDCLIVRRANVAGGTTRARIQKELRKIPYWSELLRTPQPNPSW